MDADKHADREIEITGENGKTFANLDIDRELRCGSPEAILALGKTPKETITIAESLVKEAGYVLITKAGIETMAAIRVRWPNARCSPHGGTALIGRYASRGSRQGTAAILAAGTSDLGIAEEAGMTLDSLGIDNISYTDVGVAGLHRLLNRLEEIKKADVAIVIAGMEGALASVVAGLVSMPIVAVPTSVGYGASFSGVSALLGMLNSCAPGISVVNIDNGFGAAIVASRILNTNQRQPS